MNDKNPRLIRLPEVKGRTGLGRSSIYGEIAAERFPSPIKIGVRSVAWIESEVTNWIESKIADQRTYPQDEDHGAAKTTDASDPHQHPEVIPASHYFQEILTKRDGEGSDGFDEP